MKRKLKKVKEERGVTLLELTLAMAIFSIVLGATAQALVSYYATLDMQERRTAGIQHCRSIIGEIRALRDRSPGDNFVEAIDTWVLEQEEGVEGEAGEYREIIVPMEEEDIEVTLSDALTGGPAADPLHVRVVSTFPDNFGRTMTVEVSTVLTRNM